MTAASIGRFVVAVTAFFSASAALSAETGFYMGGFYGLAEKDETRQTADADRAGIHEAFGFTRTQGTTTFDTKSKGFGFLGGYRFFQNLAVESGFMNLGTVAYRDRSSGTVLVDEAPLPIDITLNFDSQVTGIAISALGILPVNYYWEVYGRAGTMFSTHRLKIFYKDVVGTIKDSVSENAVDFLAGVGASVLLAEVYTLRAEFVRVFDAGDKDFGEGDIDMLTLGFTVRF